MSKQYKKPIIIANWKMNSSFEHCELWLDGFFNNFYQNSQKFRNITTIICPQAVLLDFIDSEIMDESLENIEQSMAEHNYKINNFNEKDIDRLLIDEKIIKIGSQDCSPELEGSFTGDISPKILYEVGCEFVILGHSERRINHNESNELISKKIISASKNNLKVILCIGETMNARENGSYKQFIKDQIISSIGNNKDLSSIIIAYEPIWAIGTGRIPKNNEIFEINEIIKMTIDYLKKQELISENLDLSIIYGGSVNSENAKSILEIEWTDGLLIGKSSLDIDEFAKICLISSEINKQ